MLIRGKKIIAPLLSTILILSTGCSFGGSTTSTTAGTGVEESVLQTLTNDEFQITLPKAWTTIKQNEFTSDIPRNAVMVFQANRKNEVFLTNVNIVKNNLGQAISSLDYGKIVAANQKNTLQNFVEKSRDEIDTTIKGNKDKVLRIKFEGKRTTTDPLVTFIQTYYVVDRAVYIVTGSYASAEDPSVQKEADNIVQSFSVK